ncbi:uncharacterized protein METZ01_LOCUS219436 [marine metagenome]|jgi:hypothetical protein|uniref:Uncharacterized protein n=1 Tax=marine metagenome TaxID=408172 RepID=A0A382FVE9_9ZZZZ|tara:strand:+ start:216 stop:491 length:276 start_codon:yes stop_codon:yes gene_type:complete
MSKKENKKREKRLQSMMTAKSSAELDAEVEEILSQQIPDPEDMSPLWVSAAKIPVTPEETRRNEEMLIDQIDRRERHKLESSKRRERKGSR